MFNKVVRCSSLLPQKSSHVFFADPPLGIQAHIDTIKDQGLRERAASLPMLITARWATSTSSKYEQGWKKWEDWCRRYPESRPRPATAFYVALYFNDLVLQGCKYGTLTTAASAIRWGHLQQGLESPMDNAFVAIALEGAKRTVGKPISQQKEPLTSFSLKSWAHFPHYSIVKCKIYFS